MIGYCKGDVSARYSALRGRFVIQATGLGNWQKQVAPRDAPSSCNGPGAYSISAQGGAICWI